MEREGKEHVDGTHRYPILFLAESYETEKWQNNLLAIFHQVM